MSISSTNLWSRPEHHLKGSKEATKAKYKQLLTREKVFSSLLGLKWSGFTHGSVLTVRANGIRPYIDWTYSAFQIDELHPHNQNPIGIFLGRSRYVVYQHENYCQ